jgi:hypothetical protein
MCVRRVVVVVVAVVIERGDLANNIHVLSSSSSPLSVYTPHLLSFLLYLSFSFPHSLSVVFYLQDALTVCHGEKLQCHIKVRHACYTLLTSAITCLHTLLPPANTCYRNAAADTYNTLLTLDNNTLYANIHRCSPTSETCETSTSL